MRFDRLSIIESHLQALCCTRRYKSSAEKREYEELRRALVRKQEEVRRLQEECAALELRPHASLQPVDPNQLPVADQEAATRIQAIHRGHLSRSSLNTAAGEVSTRTDGIECASGATFSSLTPG